MRAEKARRRLSEFVRWAWPILNPTKSVRWGWHLDAICDHLQAVSERQIRNLLVNDPPRCLKSTIAAVCWPAWHWIEWPSEGFITASYVLKLAVRDAVRSRRVMDSPQYRAAWGGRFRLTGDQNEKTRYENDKTGVRLTTSVGGGTGDGGEFSLLDDPHNVEEAESARVTEATKLWHDEAFYSRVNDAKAGGRVVIGHRVGPKDLSGHLLAQGGWTHLCLPEEYSPKRQCVVPETGWKDPRKAEGELLRPDTFGPAEVAEARRKPFAYSAQHQQDPIPREGLLYKLAWFAGSRFAVRGEWYVLNGAQHVPRRECRHFAVCDPAGGTSESADHTALGVFACTPANDLLLLAMERDKPELQHIPKWLKDHCARWPGLLFLGVEGGFFQSKIVEQCKKLPGMVAVKELDTGGRDKLARSIPALTRAEGGQIWLPVAGWDAGGEPQELPWMGGFATRLAAFTGQEGGEDDEADVLAYAAQVVQDWEQLAAAFAPRARGGLPQ